MAKGSASKSGSMLAKLPKIPTLSWPKAPLPHTLYAHMCILAIKLVFLPPLSCVFDKLEIPMDKMNYSAELQTVIPFLLVAHVYLTTEPPPKIAVTVFRSFSLVRLIDVVCCSIRIRSLPTIRIAHTCSYLLICFMAIMTVKYYVQSI